MNIVHAIIPTVLTTDHSLTVYVDKLKRVYQTPPTTWLSLPNCKHIKLATTNEKGTRRTREPDELIEHRVKGEVWSLMDSKVPVDMESIFDGGTFENICPPVVIQRLGQARVPCIPLLPKVVKRQPWYV